MELADAVGFAGAFAFAVPVEPEADAGKEGQREEFFHWGLVDRVYLPSALGDTTAKFKKPEQLTRSPASYWRNFLVTDWWRFKSRCQFRPLLEGSLGGAVCGDASMKFVGIDLTSAFAVMPRSIDASQQSNVSPLPSFDRRKCLKQNPELAEGGVGG